MTEPFPYSVVCERGAVRSALVAAKVEAKATAFADAAEHALRQGRTDDAKELRDCAERLWRASETATPDALHTLAECLARLDRETEAELGREKIQDQPEESP